MGRLLHPVPPGRMALTRSLPSFQTVGRCCNGCWGTRCVKSSLKPVAGPAGPG